MPTSALQVARTGLEAQDTRMRVIAHNLANIGTTGSLPLEESFAETKAYAWLDRHAASFGFTLSYPRDNPHGFIYEPWHWCWHAS